MPGSGGGASGFGKQRQDEGFDSLTEPVDIILPVYGAAAALERCLSSLLLHTDLQIHRGLVIVDGPQTDEVETVLARVIPRDGIEIVRQDERQGYVAAVNRGLTRSARDVVMLNSDTCVTSRWIDKLQLAATSAPGVATVTPFTNHGTICSVPQFLEENLIPAGHDVDSFAALVERCAVPEYPRIPTGVGFCMYVRREAIDRAGPFDEASFGLGYGEENDFCCRTSAAGFHHVLADDTFVYHAGGGSFGKMRRRQMKRAERVLRRRHPEFRSRIATFMREDPLGPVRERILTALRSQRSSTKMVTPRRVVHVVHGWPPFDRAGTELYASWLGCRQVRYRDVTVYARWGTPDRTSGSFVEWNDRGMRVRLAIRNFDERNPLVRNGLHSSDLTHDFARLLDEVRPELVHVHHLSGHCFTLLGEVTRRGLPLVYQVQDWWTPCARANLFHRLGVLCSGPSSRKCATCLPLTGISPVQWWSPLLHLLRRHLARRALRRADRIIAGSHYLVDSLRRLGDLPRSIPIQVIPYGIDLQGGSHRRIEETRFERPLRCGFIGSVMPHKGPHVAVQAFHRISPETATLDIWGSGRAVPEYVHEQQRNASESVHFRGPFPEERKVEIFESLDLLIVPSVGLESYGLVAREALACGVPVVASRLGALPEMFTDLRVGPLFEPGNAEELRKYVQAAAERPELLRRWLDAAVPVKSMDLHAEEIEGVYREVLEGLGRQ